jgi:hypothetical protein
MPNNKKPMPHLPAILPARSKVRVLGPMCAPHRPTRHRQTSRLGGHDVRDREVLVDRDDRAVEVHGIGAGRRLQPQHQ